MKLYHPSFEHAISLTEDKANVIIIENEMLFYTFISELKRQVNKADGSFVLSKDNIPINIGDYTDIITDIISFELNGKKILPLIVKQLEAICLNEENFSRTSELICMVENYLLDIADECDCMIELAYDIDVSLLIKSANFRLERSFDNLTEKICEYVRLSAKYLDKRVFVFVNLKQFLNEEQLCELYKFFRYEKYHLVLVEGCVKYSLPNEEQHIIDKDMCVI